MAGFEVELVDLRSVERVLALLRGVSNSLNRSAYDYLKASVGADDSAVFRAAAEINENATIARALVAGSQLPAESRDGVLKGIDGVRRVFSPAALGSTIAGNLGDVTTSIAILGMLVSFSGQAAQPDSAPNEAFDLAAELDKLRFAFEDESIDPTIRDIARRHLTILATFLRHVPIFGFEAAMGDYLLMVAKLQRAETGASAASRAKTNPLWEALRGLGANIKKASEAFDVGTKMIEDADKIGLLEHLPDL